MKRDVLRRARADIERMAGKELDWISLATTVSDAIRRVVPFERACWHPVDPGTFLFTGGLGQNIVCSGPWLAEYEYVVEDVNKWSMLARTGQRAGSLSEATHGDLSRSARTRSSAELGLPIGDELRVSLVVDGTYWAAAGFLRDAGSPWFTQEEVGFLASLSPVIAEGFRRALLVSTVPENASGVPGVVVLDEAGNVESISSSAEQWLEELLEIPPPPNPHEARIVQSVAARARANVSAGESGLASRARVQTRSGRWLLLYATPLSGGLEGRVAVIIQPAGLHDIAPLVAQAYGLTERERDVTRLCFQGLPTKDIAAALQISPYTVQDHLKSVFDKTGTRSRAELVGQVFLEHYVPRWEELGHVPAGWNAQAIDTAAHP